MLKELLTLFRTGDTLEKMGEDFSTMLDLAYSVTMRAGAVFFEESGNADEREEISRRDRNINKLERSIRKQLIAHLTLNPGTADVPYCLLLMGIVKDVERLGDYAKNLSEIHDEGGGPLPDDDNTRELRYIRKAVEEAFADVNEVFTASDSEKATELMREGRDISRRCDALIRAVAKAPYDAATTTSMVLGARYYKRLESHLVNILTGIVVPLHKLNYFDEG